MDRSPEAASPVEKARVAAGVSMLRLEHETGIARNTLARRINNPETLTLGDLCKIAPAVEADARDLFEEIIGGGDAP